MHIDIKSKLLLSFWQRYLDTLDTRLRQAHALAMPAAAQFGSGVAMGNELAALICAGVKTATCSCLWEWQAEHESPPVVGDLSILLNGEGQPVAVLETTEVVIRAYEDVDAVFASDEGEDDRTLASWRRIHWQWFSDALAAISRAPTMSMPLVCERFRVCYQETHPQISE